MNETSKQELHPGAAEQRQSAGRRRWLLPITLLLAAGGFSTYFFLGRSTPSGNSAAWQGGAGAARTVPVMVEPVKVGDINVYLDALGTVTPLNTVTVHSRVDGQLMRVLFREGQVVKANEPLAEIDPRPFQVQLDQAEGQLARDQALLKNARLDLERYRTLLTQDSIAEQQVATQASLVRQYEGTVKTDAAQVANARLQLAYAHIAAPIGGRIGLRQVDPGNIVHASDQNGLAVITQLQPISVIFPIPEDSLPTVMKRLQTGETLPVDAYDRTGKRKLESGKLTVVDNEIDTTTGTVKLKAQFDNADGNLFPNQFVNVHLLVDRKHAALLIPTAAVQRGTQGSFAYVVKSDNTASIHPVKLGPTEGEQVAVDEGVAAGDKLVVDGADKLREGAKVEVVSKGPVAATAAQAPPQHKGGWHRRRGSDANGPGAPGAAN